MLLRELCFLKSTDTGRKSFSKRVQILHLLKSWASSDALISSSAVSPTPTSFYIVSFSKSASPLLLAVSTQNAHLLAQLTIEISREKKIKVTGRSLKVYFQTACTRVKAILSSERQQQELWPYFWYSTCYRPFLFVSMVDITWFFKERKKVPALRLYWSVPPW